MRFSRVAPAILMMAAFLLLFFPWIADTHGFRVCTTIVNDGPIDPTPVVLPLLILLLLYPVAVFIGYVTATVTPYSVDRAAVVGAVASFGVVALTYLYLLGLFLDRKALQQLTVCFYLSHAAMLVCLILCVTEYKQSRR
jgi:hypothetical protein